MPDEVTTAGGDDGAAFRTAFLAEIEAEGGAETAAGASGAAEGSVSDEPTAGVSDDSDDADDADDSDGSASDDAADAQVSDALDLKALQTAIAAKDPELLIKALGDAAEDLLGTKAHKALKHHAKEIRVAREGLVKAGNELKEKFGEPAEIRAAAGKGDVDAVIAGVEKFFGASWADFIKFVNAGLAGREARLELKAKQANAAQAEADTKRQAAEAQVRESITAAVKKTDAALLAAHPAIVGLVFEKMRVGFRKGLNTPEKALEAVKKDLRVQHDALSKVFTATPRRRSPEVRPPRESSGKNGKEMTADEFRQSFIQQFARESRAAGKRGEL